MKRKLLMIPALALLLASCSSEEPVSNDPQNPEYAAATSYLSINLRPSSGMGPMGIKSAGTRADEVENPYVEGDGTYEDGSASENDVTMVRFYFFGSGGTPFAVRQNLNTGDYDNFVDWYPNSTEVGGPDHDNTVEKTLTATLGLTFKDNQTKPEQVLAVANPTSEILNYENDTPSQNMSSNSLSLSQLQGIVTDYLPYAKNNFVMSNSVYLGSNNKPVYTTTLIDQNFQSTPTEAAKEENVVTIYIERVLARVDFGITMTPATLTEAEDGTYYYVGDYTLHDGADGGETLEDEKIYVKFLGWNVTSTTASSRLIKDINPEWTTPQIMGATSPLWTTIDYHRSFWALNPDDVEIQYGNFGVSIPGSDFANVTPSGQVANSLDIPTGTNFEKTYLQENANPYGNQALAAPPTEPSKVIIAAQLVDKKGKPITICEWGYNKYTLQGLKNQIAKALPNLYYQNDDDEDWYQIDADMISFTTEDPIGKEPEDKEYYVYAVLSNNAPSTWALRNGDEFTKFSGTDIQQQVNKYIRGIVNHAMIWNTGLTYYFFDIRHLGVAETAAGYVGIVRNHLYRTTVFGIKGLGTPVYDPGKVIHPQNPNPEETVIAAKINILSWRLVTSKYEVGWE